MVKHLAKRDSAVAPRRAEPWFAGSGAGLRECVWQARANRSSLVLELVYDQCSG